MEDLNKKTVKGVIWSAIERFGYQGIQFVITILMARLLLPDEFGLIAMLTIFIAIAQTFVDSGFGTALVQKLDRSEADYSTAFYFNLGVSVVVYLLLFLAAPYIAAFYDEPPLVNVTRVITLSIVINAFGLVQRAKLQVDLDFKTLAIASTVGALTGGLVGVWMAYTGYGVWALVAQNLMSNFLCNLLLWMLSRWHPSLVFSKKSFQALFSFGSKLLASSLLHTVYVNIYTLVIGKFYAKNAVGNFYQANNLATFTSNNISSVIVRAIYPIQCTMQDDDQQLKYYFGKYLRIACYVVFPIAVGLCALAEPLVKVVLNDNWIPAIPYIRILCLAYLWNPLMMMNCSMLNVKGRTDLFLKAEIIKKIVAIGILAISIPFGIVAMCWGLLAYSFADMIIITYYTNKLMGLNLWGQIKDILPILLLNAFMGLLAWGATWLFADQILKLVVGLVVGVGFFFATSHFGKFEEYRFLLNLVLTKLKK